MPIKKPKSAESCAPKRYLGDMQLQDVTSSSVKRIAIIGLPVLSSDAHPDKAALAECFLRRKNWRLVFMSEAYLDAFRLLAKVPCDGVLARIITPEIAAFARKLPCPVVNLSMLLENPGLPTVRFDPRKNGALCARHLVEKGFTRIGMVTLPYADWCFRETEAAFVEEVSRKASQGLKICRYRVNSCQFEAKEKKRFRRWIGSLQPPFALFLNGDDCAPAIMDTCRSEGLRIPQQVALISASGHGEIISKCNPTLTHIKEDYGMLMETACEHLSDLMRKPRQVARTLSLSCAQLVCGDSTNVLAVDDPVVARALDFMSQNFRSGVNVADAVRHVGCDRRLLERRFSCATGKTVHEYLIELRIKAAQASMISDPDVKLESLARECGFGERQAFRKAFKAATGKTPFEWRCEQ